MAAAEPELGAGEVRYASDSLMSDLGYRLVADGKLATVQMSELASRATLTGEALAEIVVREGLASEEDVLRALSALSGIPFRPLSHVRIEPQAVSRLPARAALRYRVVPVAVESGSITLATARVPSREVADGIRLLLDSTVGFILCPEAEIAQSLKHFYGLGAETLDPVIEIARRGSVEIEETDLTEDSTDPGVVRFVNQFIAEAIRMDATDIHIEPFESRMRLRYRIDGVLQNIPLPKGVEKLQRSIVSAIKIMAQLNIAERRKPHDGRIKVRLGSEEFDLRVSILPTRFGETVDLRLLNRSSMFIDLAHLGLKPYQTPTLESLSSLPHGIVLITGPTGSGKTTTLYALLSRLNTDEVKIITAEDPIEYQMEGISQIQTHQQIGLDFSSILRSILRHNPDIILVGEIRDGETADIAVRSALTGHLVFSTLHTNDAASAIVRLVDMGVEPYLVSSCLEGVIAQRLVRRVCQECREEKKPDAVILEEIAAVYPDRVEGAVIYSARGCPACNFTGYRGRIALFEILVIDEELRAMIAHQEPSNAIKHKALEHGLVTLRDDGWDSVLAGTTTVEEVLRVARRVEPVATATRRLAR